MRYLSKSKPVVQPKDWGVFVTPASVAMLLLAFTSPAHAHEEEGVIGGLTSGFLHPLLGIDHLVAMIGVGLWGAFLGAPAIWVLPVVFPLVMALGGALGIVGVPLPAVESGIAFSAIAIGICVALALSPPMWLAALVVGAFAVFHGHAHGTELPGAANPLTYALGFVGSTGLLHLCGIGFGTLSHSVVGQYVVRAGGALIALVFLTGYA